MNAEWTVFFIVHAVKGDTDTHAETLVRELLSGKRNDNANILLLYDGYQHTPEGRIMTAVLWQIVYDDSQQKLIKKFIEDYGRINIGNDEKLKDILTDIKKKFKSRRFMLFTWDHGAGFGIFGAEPDRLSRARGMNVENSNMQPVFSEERFKVITNGDTDVLSNKTVPSILERSLVTRSISSRDRAVSRVATDMLTNNELQKAIKGAFGNDKIDVLIMMNCWMQMIETGFALNDCVEILIAAETVIPFVGYDYLKIIGSLNKDITNETVASITIRSLKDRYENFRKPQSIIVSAVKPALSKKIKELIDDVVEVLVEELKERKEDMIACRKKCYELSKDWLENGEPFQLIDFLNFSGALYRLNILTLSLFNKLDDAGKEYVLSAYIGREFKTTDDISALPKGNGFSIYHPASIDDLTVFHDYFYTKNSRFESAFSKDSQWRYYLESYLKE